MGRRFSFLSLTAFLLCLNTSISHAGNLMDSIMASWMGATLDEAIGQWGYPEEEKNIAGRKLYVWQDDAGGFGNLVNCKRILSVNAKNTVVGVDSTGNNCPFMEVGPYSKWRKR